MKIRYIPLIETDAYTQMAIDEMLFNRVTKGEYDFILRFYRFSPIAITIGYHQKYNRIEKDNYKIDIVRRITGGRAVYHNGDITYAAAGNSEIIGTKGIEDTYKFLSSFFAEAFKKMNVPVEMVLPKKTGKQRSELCFSSTSMYEFVLKGEKIMGSAQFRDGDKFLQQGTILIYKPDVPINKVMNLAEKEVPSVESLTGMKIDYKVFAEKVKERIEKDLNVKFEILGINLEEAKEAAELRAKKYITEKWNKYKEGNYGFRSQDRTIFT